MIIKTIFSRWRMQHFQKANTYINGIIKMIRMILRRERKKKSPTEIVKHLAGLCAVVSSNRFVHSDHVPQSSSTNAFNEITKWKKIEIILFKRKKHFFVSVSSAATNNTTTVTNKNLLIRFDEVATFFFIVFRLFNSLWHFWTAWVAFFCCFLIFRMHLKAADTIVFASTSSAKHELNRMRFDGCMRRNHFVV